MTADTSPAVDVVEVLTAHERAPGYRDLHVHCRCGWEGPRLSGDVEHRAHVAAAVVAALAPSHAEAVRAVERVRALHRRPDRAFEVFGEGVCPECHHPWPCPTLAALADTAATAEEG